MGGGADGIDGTARPHSKYNIILHDVMHVVAKPLLAPSTTRVEKLKFKFKNNNTAR